MKVDLKWLLPFVMPFPFVIVARLVFAVSGAEWTPDTASILALLSLFAGVSFGIFVVVVMSMDNLSFWVRIGGKRND